MDNNIVFALEVEASRPELEEQDEVVPDFTGSVRKGLRLGPCH